MARKTTSFEEEQRRLAEIADAPGTPEGRKVIAAALASRQGLVAARAANLVREHLLDGFGAALLSALDRFLDGGLKTDPGCHAKLAVLEALDFLESSDADPFVRCVDVVQMEPAWGPPVETATGLRARALLALARLAWPDLALVVAERLADRAAPVRQAALEALVHRGAPEGAALALYKLRVGDEDPIGDDRGDERGP